MVLDDLAEILSSCGLGTVGTNIFKSLLPSTPDVCVALFVTGGAPPIDTMHAGPGVNVAERPTVQVLARDTRPDSAEKTARDAYRVLHWQDGTKNGVRYLSIEALQQPFFVRRDETDRPIYGFNVLATRVAATSS